MFLKVMCFSEGWHLLQTNLAILRFLIIKMFWGVWYISFQYVH